MFCQFRVSVKTGDSGKKIEHKRNEIISAHAVGTWLLSWMHWMIRRVLMWFHYPPRRKELPKIEDPVLLLSATELAKRIRTRKLKSEAAVKSVISRIRCVQPLVNAVIDERFAEALDEAKKADHFVRHSGLSSRELATVKPLLGVPFTVKSNIACRGLDQSVGLVSRRGTKADEDATVVQLMKNAGAILLAVSNVPELCCSWHTANHIFGSSRNPHDLRRTAGGSSGGEAILVSSACSFLGLGNDLAGSLRIPACFNGVFSHKTTKGVVSNHGVFPPLEPVVSEVFSQGPVCHHAEDLVPSLKVMAGDKAGVLQLNKKVDLRNLKIFYCDKDPGDLLAGPLDPHIKAAFRKMVSYLRNTLGLKTRRVDRLPHMDKGTWMLSSKLVAGTKRSMASLLANDPSREVSLPLEILKWTVGCSNHEITTLLFGVLEKCAVHEKSPKFAKYRMMEEKLRRDLEDLLKGDAVLLLPSCPFTAPFPEEVISRFPIFPYFCFANMCGLPVTQCPLGLHPKDDMPIGVQVIGSRYSDRLTIALACAMEKFQSWRAP